MAAAELAGVAEAVGQDEAAFGVGVDDFDRLAGHGDLNVSGLLRFAGGHVFGGADNGGNLHFRLEQRDGSHDADHGGGSGHVVFHFFHAVGGFYRNASGVEGYAFANQSEVNFVDCAHGIVAQDNERGRFVGALGDSPESAHLELPNLVGVIDFAIQANFRRHFRGALGQYGWGHAIGRFVDQIAGKVLGLGDDACGLQGVFQRLCIALDNYGDVIDLLLSVLVLAIA